MAVFCSSLTSWFPGMLLTYFRNDFEMVPVAPIITGITLIFTFHMRCISIVRSYYYYYYYYYYYVKWYQALRIAEEVQTLRERAAALSF
jgi:hypothetical protein